MPAGGTFAGINGGQGIFPGAGKSGTEPVYCSIKAGWQVEMLTIKSSLSWYSGKKIELISFPIPDVL